ncbi:hypothetical protein ACFV1B_04695 [Streptomyces sp. NPDC059637]|uniref:hypothetical protein n=1 Tax=unclassified Streptomyces TaxID=2593676 RepID=UPI0022AA3120|nr:hypothetical protein [Streptomyces sp. HB2AG]MCZ2523964.1 hypothetical protein [Streptomyces sp. HB2AG]
MSRNTVARAMHDVGLAAWFGGSLMGAVGLNGAAARVGDPEQRAGIAADGWACWTPWNAVAIAVHLVGASGLTGANRHRIVGQRGVAANTAAKGALTAAALVATAVSRVKGKVVEKGAEEGGGFPAEGVTEPDALTPRPQAQSQQALKVLQWTVPALTGGLLVLSALHGEQQRPSEVVRGMARRATHVLH